MLHFINLKEMFYVLFKVNLNLKYLNEINIYNNLNYEINIFTFIIIKKSIIDHIPLFRFLIAFSLF